MSAFKVCIVLSLQYEQGINNGYSLEIVKNVLDNLHKHNNHIPPIILLTNYKELTTVPDKRISEIRQVRTSLYKPIGNGQNNYNGIIDFYKLEIFAFHEYDRVVYLDLDTLVRTNIADMWNPDKFNDGDIYASKTITSSYNCGVIIINKKILHDTAYFNNVFLHLCNLHPYNANGAQDIINFALQICVLITVVDLPPEYNTYVATIKNEEQYKAAKIIHFSSFPKPWRIKNPKSKLKAYYYRILAEI